MYAIKICKVLALFANYMQNAKFKAMQYAKNFELESEKMQLKA